MTVAETTDRIAELKDKMDSLKKEIDFIKRHTDTLDNAVVCSLPDLEADLFYAELELTVLQYNLLERVYA